MKKEISRIFVVSACLVGLLGGCARDISSKAYSELNVGEVSVTYQGVVISARRVAVKASDQLQQGALIGGATGAIVGHQLSDSSLVGGLGGMILGAVAGHQIEKKVNTQEAMEYVIKLTNGQLLTLVQGLDAVFGVGQRILLVKSDGDRSRIIADNVGAHTVESEKSDVPVIQKKRIKNMGSGEVVIETLQ